MKSSLICVWCHAHEYETHCRRRSNRAQVQQLGCRDHPGCWDAPHSERSAAQRQAWVGEAQAALAVIAVVQQRREEAPQRRLLDATEALQGDQARLPILPSARPSACSSAAQAQRANTKHELSTIDAGQMRAGATPTHARAVLPPACRSWWCATSEQDRGFAARVHNAHRQRRQQRPAGVSSAAARARRGGEDASSHEKFECKHTAAQGTGTRVLFGRTARRRRKGSLVSTHKTQCKAHPGKERVSPRNYSVAPRPRPACRRPPSASS